ncbi:MAG: SAM-dependent chlorinase/fluorinase, partial [Promethearchaeota archaeon]
MGIIGIMTDFGMRGQHYIAEMKGIALQINSDVQIIDISHTITHYSRIESAYMIFTIYNKFPKGSIFVCVIDPGVGTEREIAVIETKDGYYLVGPDNGIFSYFQIQNLIKNCFIAENSSYFNPPYAKAL